MRPPDGSDRPVGGLAGEGMTGGGFPRWSPATATEGTSSSSALTAARKGVITQTPPAGAVDQSQLLPPPPPPPHEPLQEHVSVTEAAAAG